MSFSHKVLVAFLLVLGASSVVPAQSGNLLKNPGAEEGAQHWRAYGDARVESCNLGTSCFVLRHGGYFIQDAVVPEDVVGQYALLIGRANVDGDSMSGRASLFGHMMNAGDPSGGRIYSYLTGQHMTSEPDLPGTWKKLWGVFKIKPGTARISFFIRPGGVGANKNVITRFDDLGLYIFPTEDIARAAALNGPSGMQFTTVRTLTRNCSLSSTAVSSLHSVSLGMGLADVVAQFPGGHIFPDISKLLARPQTGQMTLLRIEPDRTRNPDLLAVKWFHARFYRDRLFSWQVEYLSPLFKNVDEFIEKRGNLLELSKLENWEAVDGLATNSKYMICDGIEVRFYAAPANSRNLNTISLVDTRVEKSLQDAYLSRQSSRP